MHDLIEAPTTERESPIAARDGYAWIECNPHGSRLVAGDEHRFCRMKTGKRTFCKRDAAWALRRSNGWWFYCDEPEHMYGRRIIDGKLCQQVAEGSPAHVRAIAEGRADA